MLLLLFRLTTPVDQPGQQDASDVKQQKDFHGAHRRAGQGQRGAKRFWNKEAAHSANSGDKTECGGGIRHRFALRLLIAPAAQFDVVERDLTEITAIIWKVEPLPRPAVKNRPIKQDRTR